MLHDAGVYGRFFCSGGNNVLLSGQQSPPRDILRSFKSGFRWSAVRSPLLLLFLLFNYPFSSQINIRKGQVLHKSIPHLGIFRVVLLKSKSQEPWSAAVSLSSENLVSATVSLLCTLIPKAFQGGGLVWPTTLASFEVSYVRVLKSQPRDEWRSGFHFGCSASLF